MEKNNMLLNKFWFYTIFCR